MEFSALSFPVTPIAADIQFVTCQRLDSLFTTAKRKASVSCCGCIYLCCDKYVAQGGWVLSSEQARCAQVTFPPDTIHGNIE